MTDQPKKTQTIAAALREAEVIEAGLTRLFAATQPPVDAAERLLAQLASRFEGAHAGFHESQLTLDTAEPYSFEQAFRAQQAQDHQGADLLAAGLETGPETESEEMPIDEAELDPDDAD